MAPRRLSAALAALALVGASVLGGAVVAASAAEPVVSIDGGPILYEQGTDFELAVAGSVVDIDNGDYTIVVTVDGGTIDCSDTVVGLGDYNADTAEWSCTNPYASLPYGQYVLAATAYDPLDLAVPLGSSSVTLIVFENTAGTVDGQSTTRTYPVFTGTGPRMGTVVVEDEGGQELCRSASDLADDGFWDCTSTVAFTVDDYQVVPHTYLADGTDLGLGVPASLEVTPPTIAIETPGDDELILEEYFEVGGVTDLDDWETITVTGGGSSCTADAYGGEWSCYLFFGESTEQLDITATDTATGTITDSVSTQLLLPPSLDTTFGNTVVVRSVDNIDLTGIGVPGSDIHGEFAIGIGDMAWCDGTVLGDGHWTCDLNQETDLAPGASYTIPLTQTAPWSGGQASNARNYTITADPSDTHFDDALDGSLITTPTIPASGQSGLPAGTSLTVRLTYANWEFSWEDQVTCEATVDGTGAWACDLNPADQDLVLHTDRGAQLTVETTDDEVIRDGIIVDILRPAEVASLEPDGSLFANFNPVWIDGWAAPSGLEEGEDTVITVIVRDAAGVQTLVECYTFADAPESEGAGGGWYCDFEDYPFASGDYEVTITHAPWWAGGASAETVLTLRVDLEANGRGAVDCSPFPGGFSLTKTPGATVSLWAVAPTIGSPDHFPYLSGACGDYQGDGLPDEYYSYSALGDCSPTTAPDPVLAQNGGVDECIVSGLPAGRYDLRYATDDDHTWDWFFTMPAAPTIATALPSGTVGYADFAGTSAPGAHVVVRTTTGTIACEDDADGTGAWSCTSFRPGTTNFYEAVAVDDGSGMMSTASAAMPTPNALTIGVPLPPAPGLFGSTTKVVDEGGTFTMGGPKTAGGIVTVVVMSGDSPVATFGACTLTIANSPSTWQCDYSVAGLEPGTYELSVTQTIGGITSPELTPRPLLVITAASAEIVTPTATKPPLTWKLVITGVNGPLRPGQWVGLSSSGIPAGSEVDAELHSTPVHLGSTVVKADGTFSFRVQIPMKVEPGEHKIVVSVTPPGDTPSVVEGPVKIELEPKAAAQAISHDDPRLPGAGGAPIDRNDPSSPTALTGSVPTLFEILTNPATLGLAAGLAIIIMLLVAIPAEVLNSTLESNTDRFGRVFTAIQNAINRATEWFVGVTKTPIVASALLILTTSIIFGFVDPGFGFDLASLRLVLSVAIALFIVTFVASRITGAIVGRAWSLDSQIGMQPAALLFAVLGVVVARTLDFSPGFLVGLVIGLELSNRATELQRVRAIVIEFSVIVGLGVLAWLGYSVAVAAQGDEPLTFVSGLVQDTLVAVTAEGLTAVMIALVPIAFLDGKKIWERSKRLWVLIFVIVATAFSVLVLPTALAGQEIANIGWWVVVLIGFAVVAFGLTLLLRVTKRTAGAEAQKVDA